MAKAVFNGYIELDRIVPHDIGTISTTAFNNAIQYAAATGRQLVGNPKSIYLIDAPLIFPAGVHLDLRFGKILKAPSLQDYAISVTGDGVLLKNGSVDGNRINGAGGNGIHIAGKVISYDFESSHNLLAGWRGDATAGELDAWRCIAQDNNDGKWALGTSVSDGFYCQSNGRMRLRDCYAYGNARSGYYIQTSANDKCYIDGRAFANGRSGATIRCTKVGRIGSFYGDDNWGYAVEFAGGVYRWEAEKIRGDNGGQNLSGLWATNTGGTCVECFDARGLKLANITGTSNRGYGVALYKDTITGNPAYEISIGNMVIDHIGMGDRDPALSILGGAHDIHIGRNEAWGSTFALSMGEPPGYTPATNFNITIEELFGYLCDYGMARFDQAQYVRIASAISRGCHITDSTWPGLFSFTSADSHHNMVKKFYHTPSATKPTNLIYSDALAHDNWVAGEDPQSGSSGARIADAGTNNHFAAVTNE